MFKKKIEKIFSESFDIPIDSLLDIPNVQFIGNKHLYIDGCMGVKKYEKNNIIIRCKKFILTIKGKELTMLTFSNGRVSINGIVLSFQIEEI
jgi:sporulation protein YqfC